MSKKGLFNQILIVLIALFVFGCNKEYKKAIKSEEWKVKYDAAFKYYEKKDYYRSITLFDQILPIIRGTEQAEKANFYYAYAHFNDKQYISSAHFFKQFYVIYSRSEYALEAEYMYAYSLYQQSPSYTLDQTPTYEAIAAMQTFLNKYPYSEYTEKANNIIDDLQVKLEKKAADSSKEYLKLRRYKSALVALKNFQKDYPDSDYNEEIRFLEIEAAFLLAEQSIDSKKKERYQNTVDLYLSYIDKYEKSSYVKTAGDFYTKSLESIKKLTSKNK